MKTYNSNKRQTAAKQKSPTSEQIILHDLFHSTKNPLQIILSAVSILEENPPEEERKKMYKEIRDSSYKIDEALNRLIPKVNQNYSNTERKKNHKGLSKRPLFPC